jgi:raffinose/stachyose/melibiose transport system substrate-binding protein
MSEQRDDGGVFERVSGSGSEGRLIPILNVLGLLVLGLGFGLSVVHYLATRGDKAGFADDASVVRILHWQLEPGYREGLQEVIDEYNELPHIQEAGVTVMQLPVTERVYATLLNVHSVSGTAPDICQRGMAKMATSQDTMAQFFEPLGDEADRPNPYNAAEYLPDGLSPELVEFFETSPWRETFLDGMLGGWNDELQDYFAVPTAFIGDVSLYYNADLVREAKQFLRDARRDNADWYIQIIRPTADADSDGYVVETNAYLNWLDGDDLPDTLGRLLVLCTAAREMATLPEYEDLVPIAGSNYTLRSFAMNYAIPFLGETAEAWDFNASGSVDGAETWLAYEAGLWDFEDPRILAYLAAVREISSYFPRGFLGLDREQARRRFVNGQALAVATGSWDARSIIDVAEGRPLAEGEELRPGEKPGTRADGTAVADYRFKVRISQFPMPATQDERWAEFAGFGPNTTANEAGGAYMVYQRSPNKEFAIDFLQFLTSRRINEQFNRASGNLPCIVGTEPSDDLYAFRPTILGRSKQVRWAPDGGGASALGTLYSGQFKNYASGAIDLNEFVTSVEANATADGDATDPRQFWSRRLRGSNWPFGKTKSGVRSSAALTGRVLLDPTATDEDKATARMALRRNTLDSIMLLNGNGDRASWLRAFGPDADQPWNKSE